MPETLLCESCGHDYCAEGETVDGYATFFNSFGGVRADLHVECPDCGDVVEAEVSVITPITYLDADGS